MGISALTTSILNEIKEPSGVGILVGTFPIDEKDPSQNLNSCSEGKGLNDIPACLQYALSCTSLMTLAWASESRQVP